MAAYAIHFQTYLLGNIQNFITVSVDFILFLNVMTCAEEKYIARFAFVYQ